MVSLNCLIHLEKHSKWKTYFWSQFVLKCNAQCRFLIFEAARKNEEECSVYIAPHKGLSFPSPNKNPKTTPPTKQHGTGSVFLHLISLRGLAHKLPCTFSCPADGFAFELPIRCTCVTLALLYSGPGT